MKFCTISSFPPRHCGIAEFHQDLMAELLSLLPPGSLISVAINEGDSLVNNYPPDVKFQIRKSNRDDYFKAATFINQEKPDVVLLQHEFGLFGGYSGKYALDLIENIERPIICILHTIPIKTHAHKPIAKKNFFLKANPHVKKFIVIAPEGKTKLVSYGISPRKIQVISHGAPDILPYNRPNLRQELALPEKSFLVLIFGLVHYSKGIEYAILAMKELVRKKLNCQLLINCDPLRGKENEKYTFYLQSLIKKFHLSKNVFFRKEFLSKEKLYAYINASDIGILPYIHYSYISSGVLSFFVAAAKPIITTRFAYASYLLPKDSTSFVPFKNSRAISQAIYRLATDKSYYLAIKEKLMVLRQSILWENKAKEYLRVIKEMID